MNESVELLLEHLDEGTFSRELVELLRDRDPSTWPDAVREALRNRVANEMARIRDAQNSLD